MAKEKRFRLEGLQNCLARAQLNLESNPNDFAAQEHLTIRKEELLAFCAAQANWVDMVMHARWIMEGDRGSALFFKSFKGLAAAKDIHELIDAEGNVKKEWDDLAAITKDFFEKALGDAPGAPVQEVDPRMLEEVLFVQNDIVTEVEKEKLNAPITLAEIGESVLDLANGKCPGPDGTPIEFYKANWTTVGPLVHASIVKSIADEHFPEFYTRGPSCY